MKIHYKTEYTKFSYQYSDQVRSMISLTSGIDYIELYPFIGTCNIQIQSGNGSIIIHPMNQTIKIDFSQKCYGINNPLYFRKYNGSLIYLVSNLTENKKVNFAYKKSENNPFKVCQGIDCVTDVKEYTFKKGKEYIIEVNIQENTQNFLPGFSICSSNNSLNLKINLFILLFLLLIIFYH